MGWVGQGQHLFRWRILLCKIQPQIPPKNPLAEKFWGRSQSRRAKRKGVGGNSDFPLRNQNEASPAICLNTWKAEHHRKILFSLKEKEIGRAQNEKSKEYFSVVWRACRAVAGLASLLGVLLKKSSNINQKTPPIFTFCEIVRNSLGAKRLGMVFFRNFEGIFEIQNQSAVGNAEVRRAKLWQNEILQTNLFSFAFSERLSVFFFDCPKTNFKTIWTT
jgi:hypothetical protein